MNSTRQRGPGCTVSQQTTARGAPRGTGSTKAWGAPPGPALLTRVCGQDHVCGREALQHGCLFPVLQLFPQQLDFVPKVAFLSLILGLCVFHLQRKAKKKIIILTQPDTHLALFDSQSAFIYKELVHLSKSLNGT